jgi:hypothetical protein
MANQADALKLLIKIADNQQKIINKVAQAIGLKPMEMEPGAATKRGADAVLAALAPDVKAAVNRLEVDPIGHIVKVQFHPGKDSDVMVSAISATVQHLQQSGVLTGANYKIQVVG